MLIFAAAVLTIITAVVFVKATSQPTFCRSCHIMEPYFRSWETSSHKQVQCIKCHIPPGVAGTIRGKFVAASMLVNYATGVYKRSKPFAEIDDINCMYKCHDNRKQPGVVLYKEGIKFDHSKHLTKEVRNKQLRCTSCHGQIVQGSHIKVTETTCFLCHFKGRNLINPLNLTANDSTNSQPTSEMFGLGWKTNCTKCHSAPVAEKDKPLPKYDHTSVLAQKVQCQQCHGDMKAGDGEVPHERCNTCHASQEHLNRYNETVFIHKQHVTDRKVDCLNCHLPILHRSKSRAVAQLTECRSCHSDLHDAAELLFRGTGGTGVPDRPDKMWTAGLHCASCHTVPYDQAHFRESSAARKRVACTPCHPNNYEKLVPQMRDGIRKRAQQVFEMVQTAKRQARDETNRWVLKTAEANVRLVLDGGGQHNVRYSEDLLQAAYDQAKLVAPGLPPFQARPNVVATGDKAGGANCLNCHNGIETVNLLVKGRTFPHGTHLSRGLTCKDCHSIEEHGKTLPNVTNCMDCHHSRAKNEESCKECHRSQRALYEGTAGGGKAIPSAMATAGVECSSCHGTGKDIKKPAPEQCAECHDKTYPEVVKHWQHETSDALKEARVTLLQGGTGVEAIRKGIQIVTADGSNGAHNPELAKKLLSGK